MNPAAPSAASVDATAAHPVRVFYRVEGEAVRPCLSHGSIQGATNSALRRKVFVAPSESDVSVVLRQVGEFGAEVSLFDAQGEPLGSRALEAKDCTELSELVVFTLTVMVDFRSDEVGRKRREAAQARRDAATSSSAASAENGETNAASSEPLDPALKDRDAEALTSFPPAANEAPDSARAPASNDRLRPEFTRGDGALGSFGPAMGALLETGSTPKPLVGLYGRVTVPIATPLVVGVSVRGERMFETPRAGGELGAWRAALVADVCWVRGALGEWGYAVCLGVAPSMTWVSATGLGAERTTAVGGVGVEPRLGWWAPLGDDVAVDVSVGGVMPLLRNDWHARGPVGDLPLFRAQAVGLLLTAGVRFGG